VAALVLAAALAAFVVLIVRRGAPDRCQERGERPLQVARRLPRLVWRHPALRAYFFANALWETTLAALKAFILLYLTLGLKFGLQSASLIVGGVALVILIGAAGSGALGDKFGRIRIVTIALIAYGAGYLIPVFTLNRAAIAASIPFIALGGGTVMTMAYALLMPLMPDDEHGALTGFYSISRGVGIILGPILAGALIWVTRNGPFSASHGFQAMWIVCAAATFASLWFLRRMAKATEDRHRLEADATGG
jgi:MFS family permease